MGKANFHEGEPTNNVAFDFGETKQGHPDYLTGPLSDLNTIPQRGSGMVAHGLDVDTLSKEWAYDPQSHATDANVEAAAGDGGTFEEWEEPVPLIVSVVDLPIETNERYTTTILVAGPTESYTFTTVGAMDNAPARAVVGKDDTRSRVRVFATATPQQLVTSPTATAQYAFYVSSEVSMAGAVIVVPGVVYEFLGKAPGPYVKICPLAAYDSTKTNNMQLSAIAERSVLGTKTVK